jgi:UDP-glucose 4-epimerase
MSKILIAGAAGFIGRNIARIFFDKGESVIGLDRAVPENAPLSYLTQYFPLNLPDGNFEKILHQHMPDIFINCTGRASVPFSMSDPMEDFYAGPVVTFECLNSLRKVVPGCRCIYLSSAAVYGNPSGLPIQENSTIKPISPYGYHKWQGEILCQEFNTIYNLPTACVRIFSAYGPGLRRQVIWDILQKLFSQKELKLQGTGQEGRDFIHVMDVARAVEVVATTAPLLGEVYNLGSGKETKIQNLTEMILNLIASDSEPEFDGVLPKGVPQRWQADISKLSALGFSPQVSIENGLKDYAAWCQSELR